MTESNSSPRPLPAAARESDLIPADHLKIETYPYTPPGGQSVGDVRTGVRVTHLPTLTVVTCELSRSQRRNVQIAISMLETGLTHPYAS